VHERGLAVDEGREASGRVAHPELGIPAHADLRSRERQRQGEEIDWRAS
jgi:hypothetical protein